MKKACSDACKTGYGVYTAAIDPILKSINALDATCMCAQCGANATPRSPYKEALERNTKVSDGYQAFCVAARGTAGKNAGERVGASVLAFAAVFASMAFLL